MKVRKCKMVWISLDNGSVLKKSNGQDRSELYDIAELVGYPKAEEAISELLNLGYSVQKIVPLHDGLFVYLEMTEE